MPRHAARLVGRQAVVRGQDRNLDENSIVKKPGLCTILKNKNIFKNIVPRIPMPTGTNLSQSDLLVDHRTTLNHPLNPYRTCYASIMTMEGTLVLLKYVILLIHTLQ